MSRKVCVITGTRAEFGLLRWLMEEIRDAEGLNLQVIATGMHLSPEYGNTFQEILDAGFFIDYKVEMLLGANTRSAVSKSIGLGMIGFADAYSQLKPDIIVVLGDRFELLSAVSAALIAGIPVAHLHGGETTEGAFDEAIRHAVTKMSHLHFVAAEQYARRVIQLGEHPERVFLVGGLGVDAIKRIQLMKKAELEHSLNFKFGKKNLLVTFHPATNERETSADQVKELLHALEMLHDTHLIFTMPNADAGSYEITSLLKKYADEHDNCALYSSLGQRRYLSCLQFVDGVVGNSSSGIAEVPSFKIGTINIGERQKGRITTESIIQCPVQSREILSAVNKLYDPEFRKLLEKVDNPYGNGGAGKKIVKVLISYPLENILKKSFFDLRFHSANVIAPQFNE